MSTAEKERERAAKVPVGWESVTVKDIADSIQYGHTASAVDLKGGPRFLRITDIQDGSVDWESVPSCILADDQFAKYKLQPGDLVFARTGATTGKSFLIRKCPEAVFASYLIRVRVRPEVDGRYLAFFFQSADYWRQVESGKRGIGQPNVNGTILGQIQFLLPPRKEQRRIVEKIEELFSELDRGIENLKQARAQLAVYRQALLKHAFEGKLTADWRTTRADQLESADQLLTRIRAGRETRYQQQLAEWKRALTTWESSVGNEVKPSKPSTPQALRSVPPLSQRLPLLPGNWTYLRLGEVIDEPAYGTSKKCSYETAGTGVLRIPNIVAGSIDTTDLKFSTFSEAEVASYALQPGDLLMIRSNGSVSIVGRCATVRDAHTRFLFAGYLIRLRGHKSAIDSAFLRHQLVSHPLRLQIERAAKSTSGVNNINSGEIRSLVIAVCSVAEQRVVVTRLEEKLTIVDSLEADIDSNLQRAEALRQSILKKAFAGELVPQDPADEPAAALLERIRSERASAPPATKRIRRANASCSAT